MPPQTEIGQSNVLKENKKVKIKQTTISYFIVKVWIRSDERARELLHTCHSFTDMSYQQPDTEIHKQVLSLYYRLN